MQAGKLRNRITICTLQDAQDTTGEPSTVIVDGVKVWAQVQIVRGSENFAGETFAPEVTHVVTMRARKGLRPDNLLKWTDFFGQTHLLDILAIGDPDGRALEYVVQCVERIQDGSVSGVVVTNALQLAGVVRRYPAEAPNGVVSTPTNVFTFDVAPGDPASVDFAYNGILQDAGDLTWIDNACHTSFMVAAGERVWAKF